MLRNKNVEVGLKLLNVSRFRFPRPKVPTLQSRCVAQKINCLADCDFFYYGQGYRALVTRLRQDSRVALVGDSSFKVLNHANEFGNFTWTNSENTPMLWTRVLTGVVITLTDLFSGPGILTEDPDAGNKHIAIPNIYH